MCISGNCKAQHFDPRCGRRNRLALFVRRFCGRHKPDFIEPGLLVRGLSEQEMSVMDRIKRTPIHSQSHRGVSLVCENGDRIGHSSKSPQ
jgi:hypothetical protein